MHVSRAALPAAAPDALLVGVARPLPLRDWRPDVPGLRGAGPSESPEPPMPALGPVLRPG